VLTKVWDAPRGCVRLVPSACCWGLGAAARCLAAVSCCCFCKGGRRGVRWMTASCLLPLQGPGGGVEEVGEGDSGERAIMWQLRAYHDSPKCAMSAADQTLTFCLFADSTAGPIIPVHREGCTWPPNKTQGSGFCACRPLTCCLCANNAAAGPSCLSTSRGAHSADSG
jgi:hypothetical protein